MAKLYCLHEIELRPGVSPAEFEKVAAEVNESANYEGWTAHLLKGERGERNGKYLFLYEIESIARVRPYPSFLRSSSGDSQARA